MKKLKYLAAAALFMAVSACSDDDNFRPSILPGTTEPMTQVDEWLRDNFGKYNIDVLYKWNDFQTNQEYELVPAKESTVIPCLTVIQRVWMNPYLAQGGELFFKKTTPKQVMLIGSEVYLEDGNKLTAEADQGNRVTIYNMNSQNPKDPAVVGRLTLTFHHEFVHILHQIVKYPATYEALSSGKYSSSWASYEVDQAHDMGFITPYAMESANEDFAEMISRYITVTPENWEKWMNNVQGRSPGGYRILKEKEAMAVQYMRNTWGVDLLALRDAVQKEVKLINDEYEQAQP